MSENEEARNKAEAEESTVPSSTLGERARLREEVAMEGGSSGPHGAEGTVAEGTWRRRGLETSRRRRRRRPTVGERLGENS